MLIVCKGANNTIQLGHELAITMQVPSVHTATPSPPSWWTPGGGQPPDAAMPGLTTTSATNQHHEDTHYCSPPDCPLDKAINTPATALQQQLASYELPPVSEGRYNNTVCPTIVRIQANSCQCLNDPCMQSRATCTCHKHPLTPVSRVRHGSQSKHKQTSNTGHLEPTRHGPYKHQDASIGAKKPTMNTSRYQTTCQPLQLRYPGSGQPIKPATDQHKPHSRQAHQNMMQHPPQKRQLYPDKYRTWHDQTRLHHAEVIQLGPHLAPAISKARISTPDARPQQVITCDPRRSQPSSIQVLSYTVRSMTGSTVEISDPRAPTVTNISPMQTQKI